MNKTEVKDMVLHMAHEAVKHSCNVSFEEFGYTDTKQEHMTISWVSLSDSPFQVKNRRWFLTSCCNAHRSMWSESGTMSAIPIMKTKRTEKQFGCILTDVLA